MAMTAISLSMSYVEILMPTRHNKQCDSLSKRQVDRRKTRAVPPPERSLVLVDGYMQVLPYRRDNEDNDVDSGWQGVRVVSVLLCGSFGEVMVSRRAETESQQTLAAKRETSQQRQTKSTTSQPSNRTVNQRNSPCIRSTVSSLRKAAHC